MKATKSEKKEALIMELIGKFFEPEIIFENEALQGRDLTEPFVIICNHTKRSKANFLGCADGPVLRYVFNNHNVCSLMAQDLMENPLMNAVVKDLDCIPVCRDSASTDWIHKCRKKLKNGTSVIIFPEGTTLKEKVVDEFKPGFVLLAKTSNVRVLPVAINGNYKLFSKKKLKIKIGVPTEFKSKKFVPDEMKNEAERFQHIVENMYYEMINDCEEKPTNATNKGITA